MPAKKEPKKEDLGTARSPALDPIAYVLEFRAYRFDVNSLPTAAQQKQCSEQIQAESSEEVYELWESFNQFFSMKECAHALQLAEGDLGRAAQWLVSHGLQERQCPTLLPEDCTVIAQVELDPKKLSPELLSGDASALLKAAMAQKEQPPPPSSYGGYYLQQQQQPSKAPGYSLGMGGWKQPQRAESGRDIKSSLANLLKELVAKDPDPPLKAQDVLLGSWSAENGQLTVHLTGKEPWEARVFQLRETGSVGAAPEEEPLELPLLMKAKSSEAKIGGPLRREELKRSKPEEGGAGGDGDDADKLLELYIKEAHKDAEFSEKRKAMKQKVKEALLAKRGRHQDDPREEDKQKEKRPPSPAELFEPLQLRSALVAVLQSESLPHAQPAVLTYEPLAKRYYSFSASQPGHVPFVSVFQDLSQCARVAREALPPRFWA